MDEDPVYLNNKWEDEHPELYGEWGKIERERGYFGEEFVDSEPSELEEELDDMLYYLETEVKARYPREYEFFEEDIDREFFDLDNAYEEDNEKALDMLHELFVKWDYFIQGEVYRGTNFNRKFGEEMQLVYSDILHYILELKSKE